VSVASGVEEHERRRLVGMLPGAEISVAGAGLFVALVRDVDAPMPVLVERGGYSYTAVGDGTARARRSLVRGRFRLVLVDDRAEFERILRDGGSA
jgi:hypothetical protein